MPPLPRSTKIAILLAVTLCSPATAPAAVAVIEQDHFQIVGSERVGQVVEDARATDGRAVRLSAGVSGVVLRVPLKHAAVRSGESYAVRLYCWLERKDPDHYGTAEVFRYGVLDGNGRRLGRGKRWPGKRAVRGMWQGLEAGVVNATGGEQLFVEMPPIRKGPDWKWIQEHNQYIYVGKEDWPNPYRGVLVDRVVLLPVGWQAPGWPRDAAAQWSRLAIDHFAASARVAQLRRAAAYAGLSADPLPSQAEQKLAEIENGVQTLRKRWERHYWEPLLPAGDWADQRKQLAGRLAVLQHGLDARLNELNVLARSKHAWFAELDLDQVLMSQKPVPEHKQFRFGTVCHPGLFKRSGKSRIAKLLALDFMELNYLWLHMFSKGQDLWDWDPEGWLGGPTYFEAADAYLNEGFPILVGLLGHHRSLKHGWSGSSYPDWFARKYASDPDAVAGINPWLPEANALAETACREIAKRFAAREGVFAYQVVSEAMNSMAPARSGVGKAAFRQFLRARFKTIEALNGAWGTEYSSFAAIDPPPLDERQPDLPVGTGRLHEFVRFCQDGFVQFFRRCERALHDSDPRTPVGSGFAFTCFNTRRGNCIDFYRLVSEFGDVFMAHIFTGQGGRPHYYGSFNRYLGKPIWIDEFVHGTTEIQDRHTHFSPKNEALGAAIRRQNVWRALAWGCTTLGLFNLDPGQGNADMMDSYRFGPILRDSARSLPTVFREARRFEHVVAHTHLSPRRCAMLVPTTSLRVVQPEWVVHAQMAPLVQALRGREFFFVPEEALVSGKEDLTDFDLLLTPYAVALPPSASDCVIAFMRRGGTVIASGPVGLTGPFGRRDNRVLREVFGKLSLHWDPGRSRELGLHQRSVPRHTQYEWWFGGGGLVPGDRCRKFEPELAWSLDAVPADATVLGRQDGLPTVVAGQLGKGRLVWCVWPISNLSDRSVVARAIAEAVPRAQVETDMGLWDSDRVLRRDDRGNLYLFLVNHDPHELQRFKTYAGAGKRGTVTLDGRFPHVVDLTVPGGAPVPVQIQNGSTQFRVQLEPGEAIVYYLAEGTR